VEPTLILPETACIMSFPGTADEEMQRALEAVKAAKALKAMKARRRMRITRQVHARVLLQQAASGCDDKRGARQASVRQGEAPSPEDPPQR